MQVPNNTDTQTFLEQLDEWRSLKTVGTDDLLGMVLPLLEQVSELHELGRVAPLNGVDALSVSLGHLWFHNSDATLASDNARAIKELTKNMPQSNLDITGHYSEVRTGSRAVATDKRIASREEEAARVAYYPDYIAWEERVEHHDALTDVYVLGLIMASLAAQLDLTKPEDLETFVGSRHDISLLNDRLHPLVSQVIAQMTELTRSLRPQDLSTVVKALSHYRDQDIEDQSSADLAEVGDDKRAIQTHLRNKLFEISRRNRLLYFRETGSTANLTLGSVPYVIDHRTIRPEQLLLGNQYLCEELGKGKAVALSRWLRFEDYPYLSNSLDKIRLQANRDEKEYGFSQLRLVLVFLRWHNLKESPEERINSPLILVPVKIQKKKGVKDSFMLSADMEAAEINPVLRHHLLQLYGIELPARIDAGDMNTIIELHESISSQIEKSAKGVDLSIITVPRIQLIAKKAKRKLDDFRRKRRITGRGVSSYDGLAYSYRQDKYEALGVQIFERNIRLAQAPSREMTEDLGRDKISNAMAAEESVIERDFYAIDSGQDGSANQWEFDLCSITLANFNYRKMTLVRDYSEMLGENSFDSQNFDTLFNEEAKQILEPLAPVPLNAQYHVLPADPSQSDSVWRGRSGQSYVIQGPPGTGKSQTITNVIVDYLAHQKSVLFVCEKRVALDVVYHRLQQVGLESLCALIHDSQSDKKAFIDDLEGIYQSWLTEIKTNQNSLRDTILGNIETLLKELQTFSDSIQNSAEGSQTHLRELIQNWIAAGGNKAELEVEERALLPSWDQFITHKKLLTEIADSLLSVTGCAVLANTPVWCLKGKIANSNDPKSDLQSFCDRISNYWPDTQEAIKKLLPFLNDETSSWQSLLDANVLVSELLPLILDDQVKLLDPDSIIALKLKKHRQELHTLVEKADTKTKNAEGWNLDVDIEHVKNALQAALDCEGKWWLFLSSRWRNAKKLVKAKGPAAYDSYTQTLKLAEQALSAKHQQQEKLREIESQFGVEDFLAIEPLLNIAWQEPQEQSALMRQVYKACISYANDPDALVKIAQDRSLRNTEAELASYLVAYHNKAPADIASAVDALRDQGELAFEVADLLQQLDGLDEQLSVSMRTLLLPLEAIENAVMVEAIEKSMRSNRALHRFDGGRVEQIFAELDNNIKQLHTTNAELVTSETRDYFHANIQRASGSMANTSQEEKDWRRAFNRGRKLVEREFEKTRAYKSIRELLASEAGELIRSLKPIWMMSPLSVSDVLPLNESLFDVVIFDEASQIPLEDAVPALYRAAQMIVVGDEMQLPPSSFFASQRGDDDDQPQNLHIYNLNADSFLNRASGALPTTVLNWHYRSRHESLIGFCNQAFYDGQLQTIPSTSALTVKEPILVVKKEGEDNDKTESTTGSKQPPYSWDDKLIKEQVYDRPISYHKLDDSPYFNQRNTGEANYIAHLVRHLLSDSRGETLGIVAFSQAQQQEIETALSRLASEDKAFANKLEAEEEREDEGQFVGLFIKNLENVQGDERDIIILSVCYGPNSQGKMLMNFGPINQNGGEKRLNVIFSRAKKHMVVVTSIDSGQITNTYNTGANALRQYLRYARAVSEGDRASMQTALLEYGYSQPQKNDVDGALVSAIAERLRIEGLHVEIDYGQSDMKCDIAVGRADNSEFSLGILTDNTRHYKTQNLVNRYHTPGSVLKAFGWDICYVLAKDWYKDSNAVVTRILQILEKY